MTDSSSCCSRASHYSDSIEQSPFEVVVLEAKSIYNYTIPSFCAINMKLQHAVLECWEEDELETFDVFVRTESATPRMDRPLPARVLVLRGCLVPVSSCIVTNTGLVLYMYMFFYEQDSEFSLVISTQNLNIHPNGVFVIYEWEWKDGSMAVSGAEDRHTEFSFSQLSSPSPSPSPSPPPLCVTSTPMVTHVIVFKCIGAVRDKEQQKALEQAYIARQSGETVPVKIEPEPQNPYDSKAICFKCLINGSWHRIGYIVREALDEVHAAITNGHILWVKFAWIKFLLQWIRSGPGFYAGIVIARRGEWSQMCIRSASTI